MLDLNIKLVKDEVIYNLKRTSKSNITEQERKAIASLMNDNAIIMHPADKRTGVVIMDTNDYTPVTHGVMTSKD